MTEPYEPSVGMRVFGWLLALLGGLWVLLAGGCTLAFLGMGASDASHGDLSVLLTFLGIGAVCILPGAGLLFGGWVILRKRKA
jgi:hypothetical protein